MGVLAYAPRVAVTYQAKTEGVKELVDILMGND